MVNWAQVMFNSCVTGSLYLISAVALTLVYGLSRFPNFAHAEFMALSAYLGYFVAER
jgi:branched-subunit amino acid ABC-type transport system permease component